MLTTRDSLPCCRLEILWDEDVWYTGTVGAYCEATETHLVKYMDGDSKWHTLHLEMELGGLNWLDKPAYRHVPGYDRGAPHYVAYNADTRVLNMYPNMIVLEDEDVADPLAFAHRLRGAPHYLHTPPEPELARQVFVKVADPHALEVPHVCTGAMQKHVAACASRGAS